MVAFWSTTEVVCLLFYSFLQLDFYQLLSQDTDSFICKLLHIVNGFLPLRSLMNLWRDSRSPRFLSEVFV